MKQNKKTTIVKIKTIIEINDVDPFTFEQLLNFIYTKKFKADAIEDWLRILTAAHKYSMKDLIKNCETVVPYKLTPDNVIDVLRTAIELETEYLKKICLEFFIQKQM